MSNKTLISTILVKLNPALNKRLGLLKFHPGVKLTEVDNDLIIDFGAIPKEIAKDKIDAWLEKNGIDFKS